MPFFMVSPMVEIHEIDLTLIVPAVSTAIGAIGIDAQWGPVHDITIISSRDELVKTFGEPTDENFAFFFTAAQFLTYSNNLKVIRSDQTGALNAVANGPSPNTVKIKNEEHYNTQSFTSADGSFAAKYPGIKGNSLKIAYCLADPQAFQTWEDTETLYRAYFSTPPGTSDYCAARDVYNDEIHLMVIDSVGDISGTPGTILETYSYLSLCPNATRSDGTSSYFPNVLERQSKYVYWLSNDTTLAACNSGATTAWIKANTTTSGSPAQYVYYDSSVVAEADATALYSFDGGAIGAPGDLSERRDTYDIFADETNVDITLVMQGPNFTDEVEATYYCNYLMALAEQRHDCIALLSPPTTGDIGSVFYTEPDKHVEFTDRLTSSSFGVMDSCAVKVYDKYNEVFRWVPANGIVAGLCAHTDDTNDPWWSPAGFNRGQLRSIAGISYNPDKADRDELYKARINPIVQFPGEGTILFGDKTMLAKPSAFDRINVRRLFNVLEKAIATSSKYILFEFNDEFTRARFTGMVEPYLREIKGRRGIYDFRVVCNEQNNTPAIIDANEFVADIYIKPARSINFIRLNFIATPTGLNFEELIQGGTGF